MKLTVGVGKWIYISAIAVRNQKRRFDDINVNIMNSIIIIIELFKILSTVSRMSGGAAGGSGSIFFLVFRDPVLPGSGVGV